MNRLFWRVYVVLFVAVAVMFLFGVASAAWLQQGPVFQRWRATVANACQAHARTLQRVLDTGSPADRQALAELTQQPNASLTILDDEYTAIVGELSREARATLEDLGDGDLVRVGDILYWRGVLAVTGKTHTLLLGVPTGEPPTGASSAALIIRVGGLLLLIALVSGLLSRFVTRPVHHIARAVRDFAAGQLNARSDPRVERRRDELGDLARDFNVMAVRIEDLIAAQRRFVRDVSHELRSPLARLAVALELARDDFGSRTSPGLSHIEREVGTMSRLVDDLLELARLEGRPPDLQWDVVDLHELLAAVVEAARFEGAPQQKDVRLSAREQVRVTGVERLLRRALENLVRNALRHTPAESTVEVRLMATPAHGGGYAVIEVCDQGPGVPDEALGRIFEPFYRVESAREPSGGAGIGLAIVAEVVRLHAGRVRARNSDGLVVELELPLHGGRLGGSYQALFD